MREAEYYMIASAKIKYLVFQAKPGLGAKHFCLDVAHQTAGEKKKILHGTKLVAGSHRLALLMCASRVFQVIHESWETSSGRTLEQYVTCW